MKPAPWPGVLDATTYGKRCAQNGNPTLQTASSTDEDCLYLPTCGRPMPRRRSCPSWSGSTAAATRVDRAASDPVPFSDGGYFYSGANLSADGVVVVSLNYRLGVFGFFSHPALAAEGSKAGNQGLWDQRFALQWVQDNVAKFGGDPSNVTIFGESAGSFDVCMHVASPQTPALFEHAVSESGGCTTRQTPLADAQATALTFAAGVGCGSGDGGAALALVPSRCDGDGAASAPRSHAGGGMLLAPFRARRGRRLPDRPAAHPLQGRQDREGPVPPREQQRRGDPVRDRHDPPGDRPARPDHRPHDTSTWGRRRRRARKSPLSRRGLRRRPAEPLPGRAHAHLRRRAAGVARRTTRRCSPPARGRACTCTTSTCR